MEKQAIIVIIMTIISIKSYPQIVFENGYFIDESGRKIECLIKNVAWKNNPTGFVYKLTQEAAIQKAGIDTVKEFGVNSISKYIRAIVKIDKSSSVINNMSHDRNPVFHEEQLFLKVIIEGKASLYSYENESFKRYFYKTGGQEVSQLVYKQYRVDKSNIAYNNMFRQQLYVSFKSSNISKDEIERANYNMGDLKTLFVKYNESGKYSYVDYGLKQNKDFFNLTLRPGLNLSNLSISNSDKHYKNTDFDNELCFRFGVEAEFVLPYNKNKWALIIEPTFQYYKSEQEKEIENIYEGILKSKVNYKSIELPVGLRHYFYLNDNSKIYTDISYVFDFSCNSYVELTRVYGSIINKFEVKTRSNLAMGLGYKYNDRYSVGIRYQTGREILSEYLYWTSKYKAISLVFGYSLF